MSLDLYLVTFVLAKKHVFSSELKFIPRISLLLAGSSHFLRFINVLVIVPMIIKSLNNFWARSKSYDRDPVRIGPPKKIVHIYCKSNREGVMVLKMIFERPTPS